MTFAEEVIRLRSECRQLRLANACLTRRNEGLTATVARLQQNNRTIKAENQQLQKERRLLLSKQQKQAKALESLQVIVEELRGMVFGKKKSPTDGVQETGGEQATDIGEAQTPQRKPANRSKESYRRPVPSEAAVTTTYEHRLTVCPDCGTQLTALKTIMRYVEDMADLTALPTLLKTVEQHRIVSGYCHACNKRRSARAISPQVSILGEHVKQFIAYVVVIMRLSFEQVRCLLKDMADLAVSDGEIVASLDEQAGKLTPGRNRLLIRIRGAPGRHYDETGWSVQKEGQGNYAWITRPTEGEEAVFLLGRSRGKGNAEELKGTIDNQVGISDDYGVYHNLFDQHQLCMAHPKRKLRDLAESKSLSGTSKTVCIQSYEAFSALYAALEVTLATPYDQAAWLKKREEYLKRLKQITRINGGEPDKLTAIKKGLAQNAENYFTCLLKPGIPADNNKAERGLRHLVLKRKISYGSKSQKGADTMSILCSTLLSAWWQKPANFFVAYNQMLTV